jgi:hypothetical protein
MSKFLVSLTVFFLLLSLSSATDFIALAALANQRYGQSAQNIILKALMISSTLKYIILMMI